MNDATGLTKIVVSVLFFPMFFQELFIQFAWGADDVFWLMLAKRVFLLLPALAVILGCWLSVACFLTVIVRQNRVDFITALMITWWDLGRSIFEFWGGVLKFLFVLVGSFFLLLRFVVTGLGLFLIDALAMPFRTIKGIGENVLNPGIPWIAVVMTLFWSVFEAIIFTVVTAPLVSDTLENLTGDALPSSLIRLPLFFFMLVIVLGSYSVLSTFTGAVKNRDIGQIIKIGVIEAVTLFVEVIFLYREFVAQLEPWFAQQTSKDFELGIFGTLAIAGMTWLGIRGISWFLFAGAGTPTIMAVIQRSGLSAGGGGVQSIPSDAFTASSAQIEKIKSEMDWLQKKGDELLGAFLIPPLQIVATSINFVTLLITAQHLLPRQFKSLSEVMNARTLLQKVQERKN